MAQLVMAQPTVAQPVMTQPSWPNPSWPKLSWPNLFDWSEYLKQDRQSHAKLLAQEADQYALCVVWVFPYVVQHQYDGKSTDSTDACTQNNRCVQGVMCSEVFYQANARAIEGSCRGEGSFI